MAIINKPENRGSFGEGQAVEPWLPAEWLSGWNAVIPSNRKENDFKQYVINYLDSINQSGILYWDQLTEYQNNSWVKGSDGLIYVSNNVTSGQDPVTNPARWIPVDKFLGVVANKDSIDQEVIDRTNADTAIDVNVETNAQAIITLNQLIVDLQSRGTIKETQYNGNGSWYRVFTDGSIEQGGIVTINPISTKVITLQKPYIQNGQPPLVCTVENSTAARNQNLKVMTFNETTITVRNGMQAPALGCSWYSTGQGPIPA